VTFALDNEGIHNPSQKLRSEMLLVHEDAQVTISQELTVQIDVELRPNLIR